MANKSISVPKDIKTYLDGLPNASSYVVELIKRDRGSGDVNLERSIRKVLTELLAELKPLPVRAKTTCECNKLHVVFFLEVIMFPLDMASVG